MDVARSRDLQIGVQLEVITVVWMVVESVLALAAGLLAGSVLLTAFGLDSIIELVSGSVLLWRLRVEQLGRSVETIEPIERRAHLVVAITLVLLCLYVLGGSVVGLVSRSHPESSALGLAVSLASVMVMPVLGVSKRRIAARIDSTALRGDAAESFTCGYMAATVLVGVGLNAAFGWWWVEYAAALVFLVWLLSETREAVEEVRQGVDDDDDLEP